MDARLIALATALILPLSGCLSSDMGAEPQASSPGRDDSSPASSESPTSTEPTGASPEPSPTGSPSPAENTPPTANLEANVTSGLPPLAVLFNVSVADAEGDDLTWTLDVEGDGTIDATGGELVGSFATNYTIAGSFTAVLSVSDGQAAGEDRVLIEVSLPAAPEPWILEDPSGDGQHAFFDLLKVEMEDDGAELTMVATFGDLQPQAETFSAMNFAVHFGGAVYTLSNCLGLGWSAFGASEGAILSGAVTLDHAANTITVIFPLAEMSATTFPAEVYLATIVSPDFCGDLGQEIDRAPNTGTKTYP